MAAPSFPIALAPAPESGHFHSGGRRTSQLCVGMATLVVPWSPARKPGQGKRYRTAGVKAASILALTPMSLPSAKPTVRAPTAESVVSDQ